MKKLLAISSSGGHWIQLNRLTRLYENYDTVFASNYKENEIRCSGKYYSIIDANLNSKVKLIVQAIQVLWLLIVIKPDVIITTGASSGFFAVYFASKLNIKSIWIDSIANGEEMSLSGKKAGKYADLWLTQWPELAKSEGPNFLGAVL